MNMTMVRFNRFPLEKTLNSIVDDLFTDTPTFKNETKWKTNTPVNIVEKENSFEISLVAPGYEKSDFKINVDSKLLTISAEKKEEEMGENEKIIRKEFQVRSFTKTFTIDNKIDTENIEAKYVNGILKVFLSKKEEAKVSSKYIEIQ